ncbi:LysR family transcriptional regulator, glycine cleavage system transcriptional activator [Pseudosulfitobacter pseudonitzschiae]|uniref:Transcriptional regulator n=1 Tax=Pseudosulfitobacter pseudonitzschiae TaxID=1402135 RepID=A0A073J0P8_9RHOB|nr:LysR substrate-binding domain-containing protein [Pseudosulfitobacter pseudonitzschiae]KEJ96173.1 transcriptional regulator [Pseudosulfitobacter pseudonitzschiae]QKS09671.1 LysR family transcriptional regulator [Pseudosulfitobacter pseudonitzschiae]SHE99700.1 LysR family transcriptional regulator, glycine cleavage system transcriptional activator [Pseudosulfitobacter pseudonitzschiae]
MSRAPNLHALPYFEAVARRGSLARAAEEMSVSPSAVSQQIKLLEQQLGVKLFRRAGRVLSLTLEGELLAQTAGTALRMLTDAQANLGRTRTSHRLNLRVSPSFGVRWLGPRLADFLTRYPDWDLRVDAAPDPTDFDREIMDMDIRYGTGDWPGLWCKPLVHDHILPLAHPDYLAGLPANDPLSQARLIDSPRAHVQWDFWLWHNKVTGANNRKTVLMDRSSMAIQLALDGAGVVLESMALATAEMQAGDLVPVCPDLPVLRFPAHWVRCPARFVKRRPVQVFMGWAETQAAAHAEDMKALMAQHRMQVEDIVPQAAWQQRPF